MAAEIQIMIPQYGELNRIYSDFIISHAFSFERQKFITDFYKQYNDTKSFEAADGKGLDWNYSRALSFDLGDASWKDIINSTRKLLEHHETD